MKAVPVAVLSLVVLCSVWFSESSEFVGHPRIGCDRVARHPVQSRIITRPPYEDQFQLPTNFDWRNVNGLSMVTPIGNQLLPKFCGSCWAFATTRALSDRIKIHHKGALVDIVLAPQVLLDCGDSSYGFGSCNGGSWEETHEFIAKHGLTDDTCAPYIAVNYAYSSEQDCTETMCRHCDIYGTCEPVANATKYYVSEYGVFNGSNVADSMAMEIVSRGPIVCSMYAHTSAFENYQSGIIVDHNEYNYTTHVVSLVGFGVDDKTQMPYWIVRNSFGTQWGENGWFRIERNANTLLIESHCGWATPLFD